jgi:hypothetical protein
MLTGRDIRSAQTKRRPVVNCGLAVVLLDATKTSIGTTVLSKALIFAAQLVVLTSHTTASAAEYRAGSYSFSDEMGGFRLLSATGTGTANDPIVVVEELEGTEPVVLVIRRHDLDQPGFRPVRGRLTLVKRIANRSDRVWAGFHVELQEILSEPSTRADGLSFNQAGAQPSDVESDAFTLNDRRFEPFDRIEFLGGSVDPEGVLTLRLTITDPTPVSPFYLLQDPQLVSASLPGRAGNFAAFAD